MKLLLLLSGPVAVGKSSVALELVNAYKFRSIRTGRYLVDLAHDQGSQTNRAALQLLGDSLDEKTNYRWVVDEVAVPFIRGNAAVEQWLFDAVRKRRQVEHFRVKYGASVFHAHLTACEEVLQERYRVRLAMGGEYAGNTAYSEAIKHPNEVSARSLGGIADVVIDVAGKSSSEVAMEVFDAAGQRKV